MSSTAIATTDLSSMMICPLKTKRDFSFKKYSLSVLHNTVDIGGLGHKLSHTALESFNQQNQGYFMSMISKLKAQLIGSGLIFLICGPVLRGNYLSRNQLSNLLFLIT